MHTLSTQLSHPRIPFQPDYYNDVSTTIIGNWMLVELSNGKETPGSCQLRAQNGSGASEWIESHSGNDTSAVRIGIVTKEDNQWLGTALVARAEESSFRSLSGVSQESLVQSVFLSEVAVVPAYRNEVLPALLYLALRRGRIWSRSTVVSYIESEESSGANILGLERLPQIPTVTGQQPTQTGRNFVPVCQRLDIAIVCIASN